MCRRPIEKAGLREAAGRVTQRLGCLSFRLIAEISACGNDADYLHRVPQAVLLERIMPDVRKKSTYRE
jgi:hypothetical protein